MIDDNPAIHDDFIKIFKVAAGNKELESDEALIFGEVARGSSIPAFEIDSVFTGQEGVVLAVSAMEARCPYAVAFVDMRMPHGWDGIETVIQLWKVCPDLQVVICTAYAEFLWDSINSRLGQSDQVLVLKKPFDAVEVLQLAQTLAEKWRLLQQSHRYRHAGFTGHHACQARR